MVFTNGQQDECRASFIRECRQKAWGAACHAEWIAKGLHAGIEQYQKLLKEEGELDDEIKKLKSALDSHTDGNHAKRADLQKRRDSVRSSMETLQKNKQQGQQALVSFYNSIETNLALATHAEKYK